MTRDLILTCSLSPGDIVMLTAAVRDLHRAYPGQFRTDIRTSASALWENNPYLTPLSEDDPSVQVIPMEYDLIHQSNHGPYHFIHGYARHLEKVLDLRIPLTLFKGDIHISDLEKSWMNQVEEDPIRWSDDFWIIIAGGKYDFTAKWWDPRRYQKVVDHFAGRIKFVQCGEEGHWHPRLRGTIDLVGKTDPRQFVRLMYHAAGVVCPVTFAMHLAAAVETKPGRPINRACVVVAGGREPSQWEKYGHHRYLEVNGSMLCCDNGGCWKSRCQTVGDGDEKDDPEKLCIQPVALTPSLAIPRCMDMITADDVIRSIELYHEGGALHYLNGSQPVDSSASARSHRVSIATSARPSAAFITVTDSWFFAGTLATVNSIFHFHPEAEVIVVETDAKPLNDTQRRLLQAGGARVLGSSHFAAPDRHLGPKELKTYAAFDLAREVDLIIGIDSDCVLCAPLDDVIARALETGKFLGGNDGGGRVYDARFAAYGIVPRSLNPKYMSTSLYFCPTTEDNVEVLARWTECASRAVFNHRGPFPGHGDQGVLNSLIFAMRGPETIELLENELWSQHWRYWDTEVIYRDGQFQNVQLDHRPQRSFHCGGTKKFWDRAHVKRIAATNAAQSVNYSWWLYLLWFGRCQASRLDPSAFLPKRSLHLRNDLDTFFGQIQHYAPDLSPLAPPSQPC